MLDEQVPFLNPDDPYQPPTASATVWEHVVLAQRYLLKHLGKHGLSKIYYGDWCDTMNGVGAKGRGESVMLSMQVKWGCDLLAELSDRLNQPKLAKEMSAAWLYMTGLENLLGLRAEYDGLRIAPNLPTGWKRCRVTRPYRNATYEITIDNPTGKAKRVKELTVDGQKLLGTLIKPHNDGQIHQVRVTL